MAIGTGQGVRLEQSQKLRLSAGLAVAIRILRHDAEGLTRYLEEYAAENPHFTLKPVEASPKEWTPRWSNAFQGAEGDMIDRVAAPMPGLASHALAQMEMLLPRGLQAIGTCFVQALEPSGWLGRPVADIARESGVGEAEANAVLRLLQNAEPTGLFARDLADCLRLQAEEAELLDPVMEGLLANLPLLAAGETERLARICGASSNDIMARLRLIRAFDPKPGARFGEGAAVVRAPDLLVSRAEDGGWVVALNRSALPDIVIREDPGAADDPAQLAAARELERSVSARNRTLLRITRVVLERQSGVLERGPGAALPLTMADIAAELALHESTISRAVAGVSLDTPRGVIWLRALFATRASPRGAAAGGNHLSMALSGAALRARMAQLVQEEDPADPLTDEALAEILGGEGTPVARRTIAKYRAVLNIPSTHRRRRRG